MINDRGIEIYVNGATAAHYPYGTPIDVKTPVHKIANCTRTGINIADFLRMAASVLEHKDVQ